MDVDPLDLVKRVVMVDDHHAFQTLVKLYQSPIRLFMRRILKNDELADDMAQETFLLGYKKIHQFHGTDFKAWLFTIAYRLALKQIRKEKIQHLVTSPVNQRKPTNVALQLDLEAALGFLKDDERQILIDWIEQDKSHRELAESHGLPLGTIKSKILRARNKLKGLMESWKIEV